MIHRYTSTPSEILGSMDHIAGLCTKIESFWDALPKVDKQAKKARIAWNREEEVPFRTMEKIAKFLDKGKKNPRDTNVKKHLASLSEDKLLSLVRKFKSILPIAGGDQILRDKIEETFAELLAVDPKTISTEHAESTAVCLRLFAEKIDEKVRNIERKYPRYYGSLEGISRAESDYIFDLGIKSGKIVKLAVAICSEIAKEREEKLDTPEGRICRRVRPWKPIQKKTVYLLSGVPYSGKSSFISSHSLLSALPCISLDAFVMAEAQERNISYSDVFVEGKETAALQVAKRKYQKALTGLLKGESSAHKFLTLTKGRAAREGLQSTRFGTSLNIAVNNWNVNSGKRPVPEDFDKAIQKNDIFIHYMKLKRHDT